jgi:CRISPR/Cas system-associated exonuclease Cas4 (RecB family)
MGRDLVTNLKFKKHVSGFNPAELSKLIDSAYLEGKNTAKFMQKTTFSPSTVGYGHGNCARYWFIAFTGTEFNDTFDAISVANMANGTAAHERLQKLFEKTGVLKETEREILKSDPPVRGFADLILDWEGKEVIGEIKTTKDEAYLFRQNSMKPSQNHLLQILIYMDVSEAEEGFLMYENKNNQEVLILPIKMNEANRDFLEDVYTWMREVRSMYDEGEAPKRPFRKNNQICTNCPVRNTCFEMEDGEKLIPVLKL